VVSHRAAATTVGSRKAGVRCEQQQQQWARGKQERGGSSSSGSQTGAAAAAAAVSLGEGTSEVGSSSGESRSSINSSSSGESRGSRSSSELEEGWSEVREAAVILGATAAAFLLRI
jgi:hypothetical protein